MSNDSFRKIVDTVVDTSSVANPSLNNNVFSSSNGGFTTIALTATPVPLTSDNLKTATEALFVSISSLGAGTLTVGADTAANAKNLQKNFGLNNVGDSVLLTFVNAGSTVAQSISLANTSGTNANVNLTRFGGTNGASTQLIATSTTVATNVPPSGVAFVSLSATNVTSGSESVAFDVKLQIAVSA